MFAEIAEKIHVNCPRILAKSFRRKCENHVCLIVDQGAVATEVGKIPGTALGC